MRLTDEQIIAEWGEFDHPSVSLKQCVILTVRKCLALAALPDEQKPYEDVERRGFSVSQPGELPR